MEINENTKLPARVVYAIVIAAIAAGAWCTTVYVRLDRALAETSGLRADVDEIGVDLTVRREQVLIEMSEIKSDIREIKTILQREKR